MAGIIVEEWRDLWSFKVDFLFATFAWVFSNANFHNIVQDIKMYGGVAYVIAYVASVLAFCLPLIIMELAVGQLTGRAPIQALFNMCPLFKGVGVAQIVYCLAVMSFVVVQLGYVFLHIFYLFFNIMEDEVPWLSCNNTWNAVTEEQKDCRVSINSSYLERSNSSSIVQFQNYLTKPSVNLETPGDLQWRLIAAQGVAWFLIFLAILAGVRWLGKVCYLTFIIPLLLLSALLVRGLMLHSDTETIVALFDPNWDKLLETEVWKIVFTRSFYSLGVGVGVYITFGSYNKRSNGLVGDGFIIVLVHLLCMVLQIFTIIAFTGFVQQHTKTADFILVDNSTRDFDFLQRMLAVVDLIPLSKLWSGILLFMVAFMMLNMFITNFSGEKEVPRASQYGMSLSVLASLEDAFGEKSSRCFPRIGLSFAICCLGFAMSLGHTTQAGVYSVPLMSIFMNHLTPWVIVTFELLAVAWFYCAHLLGRDIRQMVSNTCSWVTGFFFAELLYILPAAPIFVLVMRLSEAVPFEGLVPQVTGISWYEAVGWAVAILPLLPIPIFMVFLVMKTCLRGPGFTYWQRFKYTIISPLRYEVIKQSPPPRFTANSPGYMLLPQAPLAEQESDIYMDRVVRVSNI